MGKRYKVGDHVTWISEAGYVSGRIIEPFPRRPVLTCNQQFAVHTTTTIPFVKE